MYLKMSIIPVIAQHLQNNASRRCNICEIFQSVFPYQHQSNVNSIHPTHNTHTRLTEHIKHTVRALLSDAICCNKVMLADHPSCGGIHTLKGLTTTSVVDIVVVIRRLREDGKRRSIQRCTYIYTCIYGIRRYTPPPHSTYIIKFFRCYFCVLRVHIYIHFALLAMRFECTALLIVLCAGIQGRLDYIDRAM